jgi:hypothetical protein
MMMMPQPPSDAELLAALDAAIEAAQPMPPSVAELGRMAWSARALDAEFAELVGDSLADDVLADDERYAIRADAQPRLLSFAAGDTAIEVEIEVGADGVQHVVGQILPPGPATVTFERAAGAQRSQADAGGRFAFDCVARGPARLRVQRAPEGPLASAWFRL